MGVGTGGRMPAVETVRVRLAALSALVAGLAGQGGADGRGGEGLTGPQVAELHGALLRHATVRETVTRTCMHETWACGCKAMAVLVMLCDLCSACRALCCIVAFSLGRCRCCWIWRRRCRQPQCRRGW